MDKTNKTNKPTYNPADFKDADNLSQSAAIISAAATVLRIAHGELCACNALVDRRVFTDKELQGVNPAFTKVLNLLSKSYVAFVNRASALRKEPGSVAAN